MEHEGERRREPVDRVRIHHLERPPNPIGAIGPTPPGTKPGSQTITARDIGTPAPYTTHHTAHATTRTRMVIAGDRRVGSSSQMGNMTHSEMPH